MPSIDRIKASDGTGPASIATVQSTRAALSSTIVVDTVDNINTTFYGTMGTPHTFVDPVTSETITVISEATAVDFDGHVDGSNLEIDNIAPGYTDNGSEVGDIIIIKPTTQWADNVAETLEVAHNDDGTLKDDAVTTDVIDDDAVTTAKINDENVTKAKLEKPHRSGLLFSSDAGIVFGASQITSPYDAVYSGEYGLTATTGASSKITVARDGLYQITMHFKCIDVSAAGFITWLYVNRGGSVIATLRRVQQAIPVGEGWTWTFQVPLLAGDFVYQQIYNTAGATRFGAANVGGSSTELNRIIGMSMMMTEIR